MVGVLSVMLTLDRRFCDEDRVEAIREFSANFDRGGPSGGRPSSSWTKCDYPLAMGALVTVDLGPYFTAVGLVLVTDPFLSVCLSPLPLPLSATPRLRLSLLVSLCTSWCVCGFCLF